MTIIIGIDPGSRRTGYGIIRLLGNHHQYISSGHLDVSNYSICERMRHIFLGLQTIMQRFKPDEAAIEEVFMKVNPNSALKLGQARGAAIVALDVPVAEYSAREIKKSVVGSGAAKKEQVQFMVQRILAIESILQPDAADALAVAICHAHARTMQQLTGMQSGTLLPNRRRRAQRFRL